MAVIVFNSPLDASEPYPLSTEQSERVQELVLRKLVDPDSAVFDYVTSRQNSDNSLAICGLVNAKNSLGGYVGDIPFAVTNHQGRDTLYLKSFGETSSQSTATKIFCMNSGSNLNR